MLDDFDDWKNLVFAGVADGVSGGHVMAPVQTEVACAGAPAPDKLAARRGG